MILSTLVAFALQTPGTFRGYGNEVLSGMGELTFQVKAKFVSRTPRSVVLKSEARSFNRRYFTDEFVTSVGSRYKTMVWEQPETSIPPDADSNYLIVAESLTDKFRVERYGMRSPIDVSKLDLAEIPGGPYLKMPSFYPISDEFTLSGDPISSLIKLLCQQLLSEDLENAETAASRLMSLSVYRLEVDGQDLLEWFSKNVMPKLDTCSLARNPRGRVLIDMVYATSWGANDGRAGLPSSQQILNDLVVLKSVRRQLSDADWRIISRAIIAETFRPTAQALALLAKEKDLLWQFCWNKFISKPSNKSQYDELHSLLTKSGVSVQACLLERLERWVGESTILEIPSGETPEVTRKFQQVLELWRGRTYNDFLALQKK